MIAVINIPLFISLAKMYYIITANASINELRYCFKISKGLADKIQSSTYELFKFGGRTIVQHYDYQFDQ